MKNTNQDNHPQCDGINTCSNYPSAHDEIVIKRREDTDATLRVLIQRLADAESAAREMTENYKQICRILSIVEIKKDKINLERDNWEETAEQNQRNTEYYRGLLDQIGHTIGVAAYIQDDGGIVDMPWAKLPELVAIMCGALDKYRNPPTLTPCCDSAKGE